MDNDAGVRTRLLELKVSESLVNRLDPAQTRDLLPRIETLLAKYELALKEKIDALERV